MTRRLGASCLLALAGALAAGRAAAEPARKFVLAAPEGSPWTDQAIAYAGTIARRTSGRVRMRVVPGGVAGDEVDTARACARGQLFAWGGSAGAFGRVIPELDALELPFLFDSEAEVDAILAGPPKDLLRRAFGRAGLTLAPVLSEVGWRSFAGRKPLRTVADFRGLRARSQESPIHLEMWRTLGARPHAISVLQTLSALQAGLVEAFDQSPVYMFATSWYQQGRVYSLSRHMYQPGIAVLCKGALESLPAGDRRLVVELMGEAARSMIPKVRAVEKQVLDQLGREAMQVVELAPAERAALRERTRPVAQAFRAGASPLGRELLEALERAIEARRKAGR